MRVSGFLGRPARAPVAAPLLRPEFLARLRALRRLFLRRNRLGDLRGRGFGQSPEFDTHRSYFPGDDPRYIDWNAYARFERLLLKLFLSDDESQVCVLLDASASMRAGGGEKALLAARFAAAFAYLALCNRRYVSLGVFAERLLATRGPLRGLNRFPECLGFFGSPPGGTGTRIGESLAELLATIRGRALIFVVSDFLQQDDVGSPIAWVRSRKNDVHLVQVLADAELEPRLRGEWTFSDAEGAERLTLLVGQDLLGQLQEAVRAHVEEIERTCRRLAAGYLLTRTSEPFEKTFLQHLLGRAAG